jgi:geranyl-CoA carboxylase beta subunit
MKREIIANFESQMSAFHTNGLLLDDGVIDPRDTRKVLLPRWRYARKRRRGV